MINGCREIKDLIIQESGIRGVVGDSLNPLIAKMIAVAYGLWLKGDDKRVLLGRDTRPSGDEIKKAVIDGLLATNCKIINLGICPTPILIYHKKRLNIPGGIIISGSHNPPDWNALNLLSERTFLSNEELEEIKQLLIRIDLNKYDQKKRDKAESIEYFNPYVEYEKELLSYFDLEKIIENNNLRVVIDPVAGASKYITPQILRALGCKVKVINNFLDEDNNFPRGIDPIEANLEDLIMKVWRKKYDFGLAYDCDAQRLAIVGDDYKVYAEDTSLALITEYILNYYHQQKKKAILVTNLASSLMFDEIAKRYDTKVLRTQIGERNLIIAMNDLIRRKKKKAFIFGGEGSCGGVIFPHFNHTRDGIFAAAKIVEILVTTNKKISELVKNLPRYRKHTVNITVKNENFPKLIEAVKKELTEEGENVSQIGLDLRFGNETDWFVLIHPSNTEHVIRIICEAKRDSLARIRCETTAELIRMIISELSLGVKSSEVVS